MQIEILNHITVFKLDNPMVSLQFNRQLMIKLSQTRFKFKILPSSKQTVKLFKRRVDLRMPQYLEIS